MKNTFYLVSALLFLGFFSVFANPIDYLGGGWTQYAKLNMPEDLSIADTPNPYAFKYATESGHDEVMIQMRLTSSQFGDQEAMVAFKIGSFTPHDFLLQTNYNILADQLTLQAIAYKSGLLSSSIVMASPGDTIKVESWHKDYGPGTDNFYNYEDTPSTGGSYGSFQFFGPILSGSDPVNSPRNLIFAYNFWGYNSPSYAKDDIGIGNNTLLTTHDNRVNQDWTFSFNSNIYTTKELNWYSRNSLAVPEANSAWLLFAAMLLALRKFKKL